MQSDSEFQKQLIKTQLIGAPGAMMLGLGLYGIFAARGEAFIDILNNRDVCMTLVVFGGALLVWETTAIVKLVTRRRREHSGN